MFTKLKPGKELTRAFDALLFNRYGNTGRVGKRYNLSSGNPQPEFFSPMFDAEGESQKPHAAIYTSGGGPDSYRESVLAYCEDMGLSPKGTTLSATNVTFGLGSTYLYTTILKILAEKSVDSHSGRKPILLMPSPTYGLFTVQPSRVGFDIETFPLKESEGWQINPDALQNRIVSLNEDEGRYVAALYHANPHNPSGAVATGERTQQISRVLSENGVFGIDDMAYSGIEFGQRAVPLAAHNFENSATLFTLSKAYCQPRARAGLVCAPGWLVKAIDEYIHEDMIAIPSSVFNAVSAVFCAENQVAREGEYLPRNIGIYRARYQIVKAMIDGLDSVCGISGERHDQIRGQVLHALGNSKAAQELMKNGIPFLHLMNDHPEAGYFSMASIQGLDSMFYGTKRLSSSVEFAAAAVDIGHVLTLPLGFALADEAYRNSFRMSFGGMSVSSLVKAIAGLDKSFKGLTERPDQGAQVALEKAGLALHEGFAL